VLFAVAVLLTACLSGAGMVLALGAGLGIAFATLLAIGASGFLSPGETFAIGLIVAGALYPMDARRSASVALARGMGARRFNR
jgi:hypothetical protein